MIFIETKITGAYLIEPERLEDNRGHFTRSFCSREFAAAGISFLPVQSNLSHNKAAYTLRGMHFHAAPYAETKLVRCTAGRLFDVIVDIRDGSPSYGCWVGAELSRDNGSALFIPAGCAHGFLTLEPDTDVFYQMSPHFTPGYERGFRWDDPDIGIDWPGTPAVISDRDAALPLLREVSP